MRKTANREQVIELHQVIQTIQANLEGPENRHPPFLVREHDVFGKNFASKLLGLKNVVFSPQAVRALIKLFNREGLTLP